MTEEIRMEAVADDSADPAVRVLVVDDDEGAREYMRRILERAGILVETVGSGREALRVLIRNFYDVLIVDLHMEEMNGVAFLQEALRMWPWLSTVLVTGYPHDPLLEEARRLGVQRVFTKPFAPEVLVECIREEAVRNQARRRAPLNISVGRYQDQLRILDDITISAIESETLDVALHRLSVGLRRLLPCELIGLLDVEDDQAHLMISLTHEGDAELLEDVKQEILTRFQALTGTTIDERTVRVHSRHVSESTAARPDRFGKPRTYLVPFLRGSQICGLLALVTFSAQPLSTEDMLFFYHAPDHLSTVFRALSRMRELAIHDGLTGLYNRMYTGESIKHALERSRRYKRAATIALVDIDRFKTINDQHGHLAGDRVLREFAGVMRQVARRSDVLGRYGGDEFIAVLPEATAADGARFANRLLELVRNHTFSEDVGSLRLTVSIGVASFVDGMGGVEAADQLFGRADEALYAAKVAGRDQLCVWGSDSAKVLGPTEERTPTFAPDIRNQAVMVVDDDVAVLRFLQQALERAGYEVRAAASADECLAVLQKSEGEYAVVLTDVNMPGKSGIELLQDLRDADDSIVTIIMTGEATADNAIRSLRQGAYDFIRKPVSMQQLLAVVERALEYRRIVAENRQYQHHLEEMVQVKSTEVRRTLEEVKNSYQFALEAMTGMLDAREQDTGRHSVRVRDMALLLGRHMGLSPKDLRALGNGSLLHDIGKIGVPDKVLLKAGSLTEAEWKTMRSHAEIGYGILKSATWLDGAAEVVRSHHERYDGSGYPRGLRGADICLGGRLFAIIDSYDAMRSDRVYRDALSEEAAVAEIRGGGGSLYDPEIVKAFFECQPEIEGLLRTDNDAVPPPPLGMQSASRDTNATGGGAS